MNGVSAPLRRGYFAADFAEYAVMIIVAVSGFPSAAVSKRVGARNTQAFRSGADRPE
jgi:hypothetical protein